MCHAMAVMFLILVVVFTVRVFGHDSGQTQGICQSGWKEFNGRCYYFSSNRKARSWNQAKAECKGLNPGADLPSIGSEQDEDYIAKNAGNPIWIFLGGTDAGTEGQWRWTDGRPWVYSGWRNGEPNGETRENCLTMKNPDWDKFWNDGPCDFIYTPSPLICSYKTGSQYFIVTIGSSSTATKTINGAVPAKYTCPSQASKDNWAGTDGYGDEFSITQDGTSLVVKRTDVSGVGWGMNLQIICSRQVLADPVCLPGWKPHEGKCYYFSGKENLSWKEAETKCQSMRSYLASIASHSVQTFIKNNLGDGVQYLYLGGKDQQSEGQWKWVDGEPWGYTNWYPGEPNNYNGNQDCVSLRDKEYQWNYQWNYRWDDFNCNEKREDAHFVCSIPDSRLQILYGDTEKNVGVRLSEYPRGRVELYKNGVWGTLCGHYWWDNEKGAENICNQLGYTGGRKYTAPGGSGPIQTGNRLCSGGEKNVWDCPTYRGELTDCTHGIDQGVNCTGDKDLSRLECGAERANPERLKLSQCQGLRFCVKGRSDCYLHLVARYKAGVARYSDSSETEICWDIEHTLLTSGKGLRCPPGWIKHEGKCYYFAEKTQISANEASTKCQSMSSHLASVESWSVQNFIFNNMGDSVQWFFLGGTDQELEGQWKWLDGEPWGFTYWYPGEPNNNGNQDCLVIRSPGNPTSVRPGHRWDDYWCDTRKANASFVCSYRLDKLSTYIENEDFLLLNDPNLSCPAGYHSTQLGIRIGCCQCPPSVQAAHEFCKPNKNHEGKKNYCKQYSLRYSNDIPSEERLDYRDNCSKDDQCNWVGCQNCRN